MKPPSNIRLKKFALAIAAFALALIVCEMALRVFHVVPEVKVIDLTEEPGGNSDSNRCVYKRSTNPVLGFELKPNYRNDSPDYIESYEHTNAFGQRDVERDLSSTSRRILLLGDSVVEGYGLPFKDTIPWQLEQLYAASTSNESVEVLNFGVSAYCTAAAIELLATKGLQFNPDTVVLVFVENDFDNFNREAFPLGQSIERPAFAEWLFRNSHLARLSFLQLNLFHVRAEIDPVKWNQAAIGDNNVTLGLARLRELADQHGFEPLVAIWPRFEQTRIVDPHPIPGENQLIVEALAQSNNLPTVRLSNHFRKAQEKQNGVSPRLLFSLGDELHPSALGARVAARAVYEELAQLPERSAASSDVPDQNSSSVPSELTKALETVSSRSPNYAHVYNRVGDQKLKNGNLAEAIESYRRALKEEPDNSATHNNLGIALERLATSTSQAEAIEHYRQAIASNPNFAEAHFNLGRSLRILATQNGKPAIEAQQHLVRAVQLRPEFVAAHFELSQLLATEGRSSAAEAGLRRVLQLDAEHIGGLRSLANQMAKQQRYAEARGFFERLVKLEPPNAESLNNLGAICSLLSDREAAIRYFEAAVAADPNHPKANQNLRAVRAE